jgi:CHAT domain-containing protein/tetratricopeptide (TPR) repeat protein
MSQTAWQSFFPSLRLAAFRLALALAVGGFACAENSNGRLTDRGTDRDNQTTPRSTQPGRSQGPTPQSSAARPAVKPNAHDKKRSDLDDRADTTLRAETLFKEGQALASEWNEASLRKAIESFEAARSYWHSAGDVPNEVRALNATGEIFISLSEYRKALHSYNQQLSISKELIDQVQSLNGLSSVYAYLGDQEKALFYCKRAYQKSFDSKNLQGQAESLVHIGEAYYFQAKNKSALRAIEQAMALLPDPSWRLRSRALIDLGYSYFDLRDINRALAYYEQALSQSRSEGNRRGEALALTAMGGVYSYQGNKQTALDLQNQAATLFRTIGDRNGEGVALNGLGYAYRNLGEHQKSLDCYLRALQLFQILGNRDYEAFTITRVGKAYEGLGDNLKALEYYRFALKRAGDYPQTRAQALNSIGAVLESMNDARQALTYYERSRNLFRSAGDKMGEASTLNSTGKLHSALGQRSKALKLYHQALSITRAVKDRRGEISVLFNIAQTERDAGNHNEARRTIEESLSIIESLRTEVGSTNLRASYFASVRQHHELYIDILMQLHRSHPSAGFAAEAFTASERARARSLLEQLGEAQVGIRQGVDPVLLEEERKLQQDLNEKAERIRNLAVNKETQEAAELAKELDQLTSQYDQLEVKIRSTSPRFAAFRQPQPLTLTEVQQKVLGKNDDSLLLEYSLGDKRSYLWAVTSNEVWSFELAGRTVIEAAARDVYADLTASQPLAGESIEKRKDRIAQANNQLPSRISILSDLILAPVASRLGHKRLLVVPDGTLQYIPFQVLTVPIDKSQNGSGAATVDGPTYLLENHEIVNQPSASTLALLMSESQTHRPSQNSVAVLADPVFEINDSRVTAAAPGETSVATQQPSELKSALREVGLPGSDGPIPRLLASRDEADAIIASAPWLSSFKATDFEASRATAMKPGLSDYRVIHFATHGIINNEHPELSGVVLSLVDQKGRSQDGFLRLHDIYNLELPVDLVVLSACNTGLGKEVKGEGLIGLTRGFMYAGASSVVASLWKVDDDATAVLMGYFYRHMLRDGLSPAAALRKAQIEMTKQKRWQSPYYWSGFIIQGQYIPSAKANYFSVSRIVIWGGAAVLLVIAGFLVWRVRRTRVL